MDWNLLFSCLIIPCPNCVGGKRNIIKDYWHSVFSERGYVLECKKCGKEFTPQITLVPFKD